MKNTSRPSATRWGIRFKRNTTFFCFILAANFPGATAQTQFTIGSTPVTIDTLITGLDVPWEIIYGPDNHLWMTERNGLVSRVDPTSGAKQVILNITSQVFAQHEAGLLGMALHPNFTAESEVFLVYTYGSDPQNVLERLVKYTFDGTALTNSVIILDGINGGTAHNGSRLLFLPDGTLLMTTGDAQVGGAPQSTVHLNGKVLRILQNGQVPGDNPFAGEYTYTFGHRNAQGLCFGPEGKLIISEHGTGNDDEFQVLEAGRNYGWPHVEGFCDTPVEQSFCETNHVKEPLLGWSPSIAPSSIVYYENNSFPEFDRRFLLTTLKTKKLVAIQLNASATASVSEKSYLTDMFGRLRCIAVGPQKEIYLGSNGVEAFNIDPNTHSIIRITPPVPVVDLESPTTPVFGIYYSSERDNLIGTNIGTTYTCIIRNLSGKILVSEIIAPAHPEISTAALPPGVYLAAIYSEKTVVKQMKLIKPKT